MTLLGKENVNSACSKTIYDSKCNVLSIIAFSGNYLPIGMDISLDVWFTYLYKFYYKYLIIDQILHISSVEYFQYCSKKVDTNIF